jgi:hypothetical protein
VVPAEGGAGERLVIGPRPEGPAEHLYTLRFRHEGEAPLAVLQLVHPLPAGEEYVPHSATGPRAEISYSVDGGRSFGRPGELRRPADPDDSGQATDRAATPADYSHIRWEIPGAPSTGPGRAGLVSHAQRCSGARAGGAMSGRDAKSRKGGPRRLRQASGTRGRVLRGTARVLLIGGAIVLIALLAWMIWLDARITSNSRDAAGTSPRRCSRSPSNCTRACRSASSLHRAARRARVSRGRGRYAAPRLLVATGRERAPDDAPFRFADGQQPAIVAQVDFTAAGVGGSAMRRVATCPAQARPDAHRQHFPGARRRPHRARARRDPGAARGCADRRRGPPLRAPPRARPRRASGARCWSTCAPARCARAAARSPSSW